MNLNTKQDITFPLNLVLNFPSFQYGLGPAQIGVMFLIPSAIIILMAPLIGHLIDVYHVSS